MVKPGTRSQAMIQSIDYAPTFLEAAGVPIPDDIQGRSLVPVFKNDGAAPATWRKAIYYAYSGEATHRVPAHNGVRTEQYKLFHLPDSNEWQHFDLEKRLKADDYRYAYASAQWGLVTSAEVIVKTIE